MGLAATSAFTVATCPSAGAAIISGHASCPTSAAHMPAHYTGSTGFLTPTAATKTCWFRSFARHSGMWTANKWFTVA
eukprot:23860-Pyramimonas_sp.AAC.1